MGQKQIVLIWGKPVTSEEGWRGTLGGVYMASRSGKITHLQARRGLILRKATTAPLTVVTQADDDTLLLGGHPPQGNTPAKGAVPFTSKTVAHCQDGATVPVRGLILEEDHTLKYLLVGKGRGVRAVPATQVEKASSGSPSINLGLVEIEALPPYSSDHEALRKAQAALEKADSFDGGTFGAVSVEVTLGIAHLNGNVRFPSESEDAEKAVAEAPGVLEVVNDLVADWDLHIQVAEALAQEGLTRQGMVTVKSRLGNVTLGGYLPSTEAIGRAARVAEGVPGTGSVKHEIEVRVPKSQEAVLEPEQKPTGEGEEESAPGEALDASSDHISESSTPG